MNLPKRGIVSPGPSSDKEITEVHARFPERALPLRGRYFLRPFPSVGGHSIMNSLLATLENLLKIIYCLSPRMSYREKSFLYKV